MTFSHQKIACLVTFHTTTKFSVKNNSDVGSNFFMAHIVLCLWRYEYNDSWGMKERRLT